MEGESRCLSIYAGWGLLMGSRFTHFYKSPEMPKYRRARTARIYTDIGPAPPHYN